MTLSVIKIAINIFNFLKHILVYIYIYTYTLCKNYLYPIKFLTYRAEINFCCGFHASSTNMIRSQCLKSGFHGRRFTQFKDDEAFSSFSAQTR